MLISAYFYVNIATGESSWSLPEEKPQSYPSDNKIQSSNNETVHQQTEHKIQQESSSIYSGQTVADLYPGTTGAKKNDFIDFLKENKSTAAIAAGALGAAVIGGVLLSKNKHKGHSGRY